MSKTPKKFALIGTSCVGKTTLLLKLKDYFAEKKPHLKVTLVNEAARLYFSTHKTRKPFSFYHQEKIQKLIQKMEQEASGKKYHLVFCDRSVFDAVPYVASTKDEKSIQILLRRANKWLHTYTHLFLLDPKDIPYQKDEIRKESKYTREKFHKLFQVYLQKVSVPWTIIGGTEKDRLEKISSIIYNHVHEKRTPGF